MKIRRLRRAMAALSLHGMQTASLGFPRIGAERQLKRALEALWAGRTSPDQLRETARELRARHWALQASLVEIVPCNDFSLYDHVLDTAVMLGAAGTELRRDPANLETYFELARGRHGKAWEMTKWFNTNYHYLVPELDAEQSFEPHPDKLLAEWSEAKQHAQTVRPVLLGPVTFLMLARREGHDTALGLLERLLPAYQQVLHLLAQVGVEQVQIDEPCLGLDLPEAVHSAYRQSYTLLTRTSPLRLMLTSYFGALQDNLPLALGLGTHGLHLDLVEARHELDTALTAAPQHLTLSLGLVNGRNVFRTDLAAALDLAERAVAQRGAERIVLAPSCSLLHCPIDLDLEAALDSRVRARLSFSRQKLGELQLLARGLRHGRQALAAELRDWAQRREQQRVEASAAPMAAEVAATQRTESFEVRKALQQDVLNLPLLPTTTIGSFPQTPQLRQRRAQYRAGQLSEADYQAFLRDEIRSTIELQEALGLDVLVHGEPERSDMVEYFAELLEGVAVTEQGWVQSYGSRCVRPPIIYGPVKRPRPMTVAWTAFAQSCTKRPVKGMLTGPITLLQWSYVREDQPRSTTCAELAQALRLEVRDLVEAGVKILQIDEPALREGLPLRRAERAAYLSWAVACFRTTAQAAPGHVQVHSHMCYGDFEDIEQAIIAMDVDVLSLEAARSRGRLFGLAASERYVRDLGPGSYDIHSPRIPSEAELRDNLQSALSVLQPSQLWVNPDCGLKTRQLEEVIPALANMVRAARQLRAELFHSPAASAGGVPGERVVGRVATTAPPHHESLARGLRSDG